MLKDIQRGYHKEVLRLAQITAVGAPCTPTAASVRGATAAAAASK